MRIVSETLFSFVSILLGADGENRTGEEQRLFCNESVLWLRPSEVQRQKTDLDAGKRLSAGNGETLFRKTRQEERQNNGGTAVEFPGSWLISSPKSHKRQGLFSDFAFHVGDSFRQLYWRTFLWSASEFVNFPGCQNRKWSCARHAFLWFLWNWEP